MKKSVLLGLGTVALAGWFALKRFVESKAQKFKKARICSDDFAEVLRLCSVKGQRGFWSKNAFWLDFGASYRPLRQRR